MSPCSVLGQRARRGEPWLTTIFRPPNSPMSSMTWRSPSGHFQHLGRPGCVERITCSADWWGRRGDQGIRFAGDDHAQHCAKPQGGDSAANKPGPEKQGGLTKKIIQISTNDTKDEFDHDIWPFGFPHSHRWLQEKYRKVRTTNEKMAPFFNLPGVLALNDWKCHRHSIVLNRSI